MKVEKSKEDVIATLNKEKKLKQKELEKKRLLVLKQEEINKKQKLDNQKRIEKKYQQKIISSVNKEFEKRINSLGKIDKSETVYDPSTNRTWQDNKDAKNVKDYWHSVKRYCQNLNFKGKSDWYLPSLDELKTIVDKTKRNNHKKEFKNSTSDAYWSSTEYSPESFSSPAITWYFSFYMGEASKIRKNYDLRVRCVRKGQLDTFTFSASKDFKLYVSAGGKKKIKDKSSFSKDPFSEIQKLTQELTNIYFEPRKISKNTLRKIDKPSLPQLPKLTKGEYETKVMFQKRVNKEIKNRESRILQLQKQYRLDVENRNERVKKINQNYLQEVKSVKAEQKYKKATLTHKISVFQKSVFETVMGGFTLRKRSYDAETSTLYVTMKAKKANYSKKVSIKISPSYAKSFSDNISTVKVNPIFTFINNRITLKSIDVKYDNNNYLAVLNSKDFIPEKIVVKIKEKKVRFESAKQMRLSLQNPNLKDTYEMKAFTYKDGKKISGDIFNDDIPKLLSKIKRTKIDKTKWLFTIGIENYNETDNIKYSKRSALAFKKVAQKTLGIKERNSYTLINSKATGTAIKNKLRLLLSEVKKDDTIYFYYNGHGIPDSSKHGEPYMLPSDGIPDFIVSEKEFSLKNIYKKLSDSKASKVVAFIDSCFSGATDGVSIIKGVAGSRLAPKRVIFDKSKMVVLTAGQKKQYSNMHKEKGHRMFSYFVMKSLLDGKKDINMLYKEVSYKVSEASNELGALKKQEPTLDGNKKIKL
ncbi:MAG: DUF1566 domain-containing protein [Campylobacterota bacterium]|nr:DUF1566 domain-containing protein [Campylobacterota bacterium]